jgi:carbonic anhydrase/acetyltransferase-like protein (isoleucine patch superfamily)
MIARYKKFIPLIGKNVFVAKNSTIIGDVSIGDNSSIWFGSVLRGDVNKIQIGKRSNIQDLSLVHIDEPKPNSPNGYSTTIGDDVTIGHSCTIHGCNIGNACLVGMGATILNGVIIGDECIIGANSLLTQNKNFPPQSLIVGSPARVLRKLTSDEIAFLYKSSNNYVKNKNTYLSNDFEVLE